MLQVTEVEGEFFKSWVHLKKHIEATGASIDGKRNVKA